MDKQRKRQRLSSSDSSIASDSCTPSKERKQYERKLKERENLLETLESVFVKLQKNKAQNSTTMPGRSTGHETPSFSSVQTPRHINSSTVLNPSNTVVRYVGRNDFIPEFDPQISNVSVEHWIRNLESVARMHGWDETTLICNCTSKLRGYAKSWYERQASYDMSWEDWKLKLIQAFPFTKNKLAQIRELVNRVKAPNEDPIKFYYDKLGLGMSCAMTDDVIAEAIIGTLGDKFMEIGAVSAGCCDTRTLLKYLASVKNSAVENVSDSTSNTYRPTGRHIDRQPINVKKCYVCGKAGHLAKSCGKNRDVDKKRNGRRCRYCDKIGHQEDQCFKRNTEKQCSYCKISGHTQEECRKKLKAETSGRTVRKIQIECSDFSDKKYFKTVFVNGNSAQAYIDFGSTCNTMKQSFSDQLGLKRTVDDSIVIKGYGNALTLPLGVVTAQLSVDGVERQTNLYVVPDRIQDFDILVGQPFTEEPDIIVVKTSTQLKIYESEMESELIQLCADLEKIQLYPEGNVVLKPGLNKINVVSEPIVTGDVKLRHSEQRKPMFERDILSEKVRSQDGYMIIKVINKTNGIIQLRSEDCVARADLINECDANKGPKIGENLTKLQREELNELLYEYENCFSGNGMVLGNCNVEMSIKLTEDKVINYKPYRMSFHEREIVRQTVAELLKAGIIETSKSPYASPVLLVKKKDGGYRMCIDYRALNKITEKERYPLPIIQDLLDRLVHKLVFCCLDLANGYHQIKIAPSSRPFTGFITPDGHYQYRMMSFGLCNAPAVFQRAMNEILAPVIHECAEVYIDDVIVWGEDVEECLKNLRKVLGLLAAAGVKLKRDKCSFLTNEVEYLGHEISGGEIRPSSHKIDAVKNFKPPRNVHELRQFLGLASYFRKFIHGFATKAQPLTKLTKKNQDWCWGKDQIDAVQTLKESLTSDPVLVIYDPGKESEIHTDASKLGLGGVLLQRQSRGELGVVAYASRQTTATEQKYHSFELEALAVVFSIQKFRVYITGTKFRVITDCSALRMAWSKRDLSPRIARWWLDLQEYSFDVEHRPGTSMSHVDALSRNPITINHIEEKDLIDILQEGDEEIQGLITNLKLEIEAKKNKKDGLRRDYKIENEKLFRVVNGEMRPVLPKGARLHIMKIYHDDNGHLGAEKCTEAIQAKYWFPKMKKVIGKYVSSCIGCQFTKKPSGKQPGLLHPIPRTPVPFHTVHVDHLGPFTKSSGRSYIFAIIDGFTKFVWLEAVATANARGAISALTRLGQVFGHPVRIVSDRGSAFTGRDFEQYCDKHGIKHVLNAVATPRANGQVERLNRTILASLSAHVGEEQKGWDGYLPQVQLGINSTVCQGTGKSPLELLCGYRPRLAGELEGPTCSATDLETLREEATKEIDKNAAAMKVRYDKRRLPTKQIDIGTLVLVERRILRPGLTSGKLVPRYAGPYKVTAVLPNDRYEVSSVAKGKKAYKNIVARDKMKTWCLRDDLSPSNN